MSRECFEAPPGLRRPEWTLDAFRCLVLTLPISRCDDFVGTIIDAAAQDLRHTDVYGSMAGGRPRLGVFLTSFFTRIGKCRPAVVL